jgi:hypothetical protein
MVRRQISETITSIISSSWYFTTKSDGIWKQLPACRLTLMHTRIVAQGCEHRRSVIQAVLKT